MMTTIELYLAVLLLLEHNVGIGAAAAVVAVARQHTLGFEIYIWKPTHAQLAIELNSTPIVVHPPMQRSPSPDNAPFGDWTVDSIVQQVSMRC